MIRFYLKLYKTKGEINGFEYPKNLGYPNPENVETYDITNFVVSDDDITINKRVEYDGLDSITTDEIDLTIIRNSFTEELLFGDYFKSLHIEDADNLYFAGFIDNNRIVNYNEETFEIKANGVLAFLLDLINHMRIPPPDLYTPDSFITFLKGIFITYCPFVLFSFLQSPQGVNLIKTRIFNFFNIANNDIIIDKDDYYKNSEFSKKYFNGVHDIKYTGKDLLLEFLKRYILMIFVDNKRNLIIQSKLHYLTPQPPQRQMNLVDIALDDIIWEKEYSQYNGIILNVKPEGWWALFEKNSVVNYYQSENRIVFYRRVKVSRKDFRDGEYLDLRPKILVKENNVEDVKTTFQTTLFTDYPTCEYDYGYYFRLKLYERDIRDPENYEYEPELDIQYGFTEKLLNKKTSILKTTLTGLDYNIGDFFEFNGKIFILYEMKLNLTQNTTEVAMREIK